MKKVKQLIPIAILLSGLLACNFPGIDPELVVESILTTQVPENTPTATNTPLPTPTPTPLPAARVELGDRAIFYGDWESAFAEYRDVLQATSDNEIQSAALLGLARTDFLARNLGEARSGLEELITRGGEATTLADAYFFLAQINEVEGKYHAAAEAYAQYLDLRPGVIDEYVNEQRGDNFSAAGDYTQAIAAYQDALGSSHQDSGLDIEIKLARAYELSGDLATAIVAYQDIYSRTANDATRATLDYWLGQAYIAAGDPESGYAAYMDAVLNFPRAHETYLALVEVVDAGLPVDELQRGLIDYYAGQYSVAIAAFERYLNTEPADIPTALFYLGLSQHALGDLEGAKETWGEIILSYPESAVWVDAWEKTAETLWLQQGEYQAATQTLLDFVEQAPTHPAAGDFLFQAAAIAERGERLDQAAEIWDRVVSEYPGDENASRAFFLAGITSYRLADYPAAEDFFQRLLAFSSELEERSAAYLWLGKSRFATGDEQAARTAWEQAALVDPTGYYSERAKDILAGIEPFTPPLEYDFGYDVAAEKREAEDWIRTIFGYPEETDLTGIGPIAGDDRFTRGNEFWRLGLYEEARAEFEDLRSSLETEPANSYRLANYLVELGLYRSAIFAARQVLSQAGMNDAETMSAPVYFNHLRFGPYYREIVFPASQAYNFHPLFLFSVMRQESLFEGFVRSSAGARGLMQIIPTTGREIAANAGWPPDYSDEDLYRPLVSVNLGSDYLNRQRGFVSGDLYAALAAYNAGPGNAATWKSLVPSDSDLFLEVIRFQETREYIKGIYEIFNIYTDLYDRTP